MKIKALLSIIIIGLVVVVAYHFIAIAAIDAPHNEASNVSCGSCHDEGLLQSLWGGSGLYSTVDELCLSCHAASSGPYTDVNAPVVKTHIDYNGEALAECRTCHDPHYQKQKLYKNTDANNLYLVTGTITNCSYSPPVPPETVGTSTLWYDPSSLIVKPGWDFTRLTEKTLDYRSAILFPNVKKLGYSYPIIIIIPNLIRVKGDARPVYQYITTSDFAITYGQYVRDILDGNTVKFFDQEGDNSFADGNGTYSVCEICHTLTGHFRNDGNVPDQNHINIASNIPGKNCVLCHPHTEGFIESGGCVGCHSVSFNGRAAVSLQFEANSHHVQDVPLMGEHCYECHWEANFDGSINNVYHEGYNTDTKSGVPGEKIDLVIYGEKTRPITYTEGTTAIQYMADGTRSEVKELNAHCLSCHSDQNDTYEPFGDGKTPKEYAWDNTSIDAKYSQTEVTKWGKYTDVANAAKKNINKAYSAHGNAILNEGGWSEEDGVDGTIPNTRDGAVNVACFDCHNSHGSSIEGTTTSYTSATTNGGILKDMVEGLGGATLTYKPSAGGSADDKNAYSVGAGLCFDCHMNASAGTTPWGYENTFGASEPIMGYWDTPYFSPGTFAAERRYAYKMSSHKGGHFGRSSNLDWFNPPTGSIGGLCTPCHDPHGVSPNTTECTNMAYCVPLLKGTWLTSPYKEDAAPVINWWGTIRTDTGAEGIYYNIDQNTFGSEIAVDVDGIQEELYEDFAGLCMKCHPKDGLLSGSTSWKGKARIHQSVKGWGGYGWHKYSCSKCHTPHNSRLPRLMVTNCLDSKHKGYLGNNPDPKLQGTGTGYGTKYDPVTCDGFADSPLGFCPKGALRPKSFGTYNAKAGIGHIPGSWGGSWPDHIGTSGRVTCHEGKNAGTNDHSWNSKTRWSEDGFEPEILSGPFVDNFEAVGADIRATVIWITRSDSSSCVDYGPTDSYGNTECDATLVTNHSITLTGLENHTLYHYMVRSHDGVDWTESGDHTFYASVPPTVPTSLSVLATICYEPCDITFQWDSSTDPGDDNIEYYIEAINEDTGAIYISGWITEAEAFCDDESTCSWTATLPIGYWCWKIRARNESHTEAVSDWSNDSCFNTAPRPSTPILISEPDVVNPSPVTVTLEWLPAASQVGNMVDYVVDLSDTGNFTLDLDYSSGWISDTTLCSASRCSWSITLDADKTWSWRVRARDAVYTHSTSASGTDSFVISANNAPPTPTLIPRLDVISGVPVGVTLEWEDVDDPDGDPVEYYVEVDSLPNFWYLDPDLTNSGWLSETDANCDGSTCNWTVTITSNKTWYWRVRARDADHTDKVSQWSVTDSFFVMTSNPPPTPTLVDLPYAVGTVPVDVTLEWEDVADSVEYYVQVDDVSNFITPNYTSGWLSETAANCDGSTCNWTVTITSNKTWYWRVRARDSVHIDATSAWSSSDSFKILSSNPPPAPALTDETDVATTIPIDVTLEWEDVDDPDVDPVQYDVQVSEYSNFALVVHDSGWIIEAAASCDGSTCSWTFNAVNNGKRWYWRVQARDADHTDATSAWSVTDSFSLFSSVPPPAPLLTDEPDGSSSSSPATVTLEWEDVADSVEYYVQLDDYSNFLAPNHESGWMTETVANCDGSTCNWTVNVATDTTWYWRVQARDAVNTDAESLWSDTDSFTISMMYPDDPPAPTLINEPDYVSTGTVNVTLEWMPVTCPDGHDPDYYVEVADNPDLTSPTSPGWISDTSWDVTLDPDKTWYWRVRARDDDGHPALISVWSGIDSFKINLVIIKESFEKNIGVDGTGYDETWTETVGANCTLDPDSPIPGTTLPPDAGVECLKSVSSVPGYQAYAQRDYGSEEQKTFTRFWLYVEDEGVILDWTGKYMAAAQDNADNYVFMFRLSKISGELFLNLRIYNDGDYQDYGYNNADVILGKWHKIDIKYDNTDDTWEWRFDGEIMNSGTLTGTHYNGIQKWNLGYGPADMITGTIYFDLFTVNTIDFIN